MKYNSSEEPWNFCYFEPGRRAFYNICLLHQSCLLENPHDYYIIYIMFFVLDFIFPHCLCVSKSKNIRFGISAFAGADFLEYLGLGIFFIISKTYCSISTFDTVSLSFPLCAFSLVSANSFVLFSHACILTPLLD